MAGIKRYLIRLGDSTTHGGQVVSAWGQDAPYPNRINSIPAACVGDKVTCPKCGGTHTIIAGDTVGHRLKHLGRVVASTADYTTCGAQLIASQNFVSYTDESWGHPVQAAFLTFEEAAAAQGIQSASASQTGGRIGSGNFSEQFRLVNESTGEPISGAKYRISTQSGLVHEGETDSDGKTVRVYTAAAEHIECAIV